MATVLHIPVQLHASRNFPISRHPSFGKKIPPLKLAGGRRRWEARHRALGLPGWKVSPGGSRHRGCSVQCALTVPSRSSGNSNARQTGELVRVPKSGGDARNLSMYNDPADEALAASRAVNATYYDPEKLSQLYSQRPFQVFRRMFEISLALGTVASAVVIDNQRGVLDENMPLRATQLRKALTNLGPTFVKLGQALSTRPDLCPQIYLDELALLQDALPIFPNEAAFSLIEKELAMRLEDVFEVISPNPIAAASLGQVYKAKLLGSGQTVAVKVQRPGIEAAIGLDFFLLRTLFKLVDKYATSLTTSLVSLLDDFASRVYEELNYVQEARNAIRFGQLYGDRPDVLVPKPIWRYTSIHVLCMEWVDGVKLSNSEQMAAQGLDVVTLVETGIQCSLRQLLEHGYFHADPHPGNLLATPDGRLAFLDFGMMSETPPKARYAIIGHVVHLVNRDYEAMARDYYALDFLEPDVDVSPIVPALRGFFDDVLKATVSELNFKTIVDGLGAVLYQYPFNVPAYYALILRSLTVLEGLALYTDPNFKVLAAAYPYMAKRLLTDQNPYLRDALIELLFKDGSFRWNRLENLLVQGKKDRDYNSSEVLRPILNLLLGPEGLELRYLVEKEAVRVTEAMLLGSALEGFKSLPEPFRTAQTLLPMPAQIAEKDQQALLELRSTVLRCWSLLRSSQNFEPSSLEPLVQVLMQPEAQIMGTNIAGGVAQRLAARMLRTVLTPLQNESAKESFPAAAASV